MQSVCKEQHQCLYCHSFCVCPQHMNGIPWHEALASTVGGNRPTLPLNGDNCWPRVVLLLAPYVVLPFLISCGPTQPFPAPNYSEFRDILFLVILCVYIQYNVQLVCVHKVCGLLFCVPYYNDTFLLLSLSCLVVHMFPPYMAAAPMLVCTACFEFVCVYTLQRWRNW